jgi:hypothetical protein
LLPSRRPLHRRQVQLRVPLLLLPPLLPQQLLVAVVIMMMIVVLLLHVRAQMTRKRIDTW